VDTAGDIKRELKPGGQKTGLEAVQQRRIGSPWLREESGKSQDYDRKRKFREPGFVSDNRADILLIESEGFPQLPLLGGYFCTLVFCPMI